MRATWRPYKAVLYCPKSRILAIKKMSESSRLVNARVSSVDVRPPAVYRFRDWLLFENDTLRYHSIVLPGKSQLNDRIMIFRKYMSSKVDKYLRSKRPGIFESSKFETWTVWLSAVRHLLREKDSSTRYLLESPFDDTAVSWIGRYQGGTITERELWLGLNELVDQDEISTDEQIRIFWESHSGEQQEQLVNRCPYFDPNAEIWDETVAYADRMIAQRSLNDFMQSDIDGYALKYRKLAITYGIITMVLTCAGTVLLAVQAIPTLSTYYDHVAYAVCAGVGLLCFTVDLFLMVVLLVYILKWTKVSKAQRAYHSGILP